MAQGDTGIGVIVGSPNGITARHWLNDEQSIDANAGWTLGNNSRFQLSTDFLWSRLGLIKIEDEAFDFFFGGGLSLRTKSGKNDNEVVFGPRIPVGASYEFKDPDIELFTQLALNVGLVPSSDVYFDFNLGVRFLVF